MSIIYVGIRLTLEYVWAWRMTVLCDVGAVYLILHSLESNSTPRLVSNSFKAKHKQKGTIGESKLCEIDEGIKRGIDEGIKSEIYGGI